MGQGYSIGALLGLVVLPAGVLSWALGWLVRRWAPRLGLVDRPAGHKAHAQATPLGGGLAIWIGVLLPLGTLQALSVFPGWESRFLLSGWSQAAPLLWQVALGSTLLMILGLVDDWIPLNWRWRLGAQVLVAGALVSQGLTITVFLNLPWLTAVLTTLWIVALVNSLNMLDNMDGLSGGVAAIAAAMLALALHTRGEADGTQLPVIIGLLLLAGSLAGFLYHNLTPARLFMGDAGSYFIGFWMAALTVMATFSSSDGSSPPRTILAPLCVLAVPLYDLTTVVLIRLRAGQSPFQPDHNHVSHRLVRLGLSRSASVSTIHVLTLATSLGGLVLYDLKSDYGAALVLGMIVCLLYAVYQLEQAAGLKDQ